MKVTADNYESLKAFSLWLSDQLHREFLEKLEPEAHPRFAIEQFEGRSMSQARKSVQMMIGDLIEETDCLSDGQVKACDDALGSLGLPTLTEVRAQFGRRIRSILKRGTLRNEDDYYALRNAADALPVGDRERAWSMLDEFMIPGAAK